MSKSEIAILGGNPLSPNMQSVLSNWGRMLSEDFDLSLIVGEGFRLYDWSSNYKVHRVKSSFSGPASIIYAWEACRDYLLEEPQPDILMNVGQPTLATAVAYFGSIHDIPAVVRYTGDPREAGLGRNMYERFKSWLIQGKLNEWACNKADKILTLGKILGKKVVSKGYDYDKVVELPQPFDPEPFKSSSDESKQNLKRNLGLHPDKKTILFVGRLSWWKGADRLLNITERLEGESTAYQFCLLGEGSYKSKFARFEEDFVLTLGRVPPKEVSDYYRASDLFLLPSRTEGLPNVILEALAAGLPVIASPVGEIPTYISNLADSVNEYSEYLLRENWKKDPLPDYFDWENQKREYLEFFRSVIEKE